LTKVRSVSIQRAPPAALDANALELFARIAGAGSFAQAARQIGQTRAAISRRVAYIEAQLGAPLFVRSTRALGLTEAGRRLATQAKVVLEATNAARRAVRSKGKSTGPGGGQLSGTLRITSIPSFGQAVLGPLLARFQALHPAMLIELRLTHRRVDLLREDIDLAFRVTDKPPPDCIAQPVLPFVARAYAAPGLNLRLAHPRNLAAQRCLLFGVRAEPLVMNWRHRDGEAHSVNLQAVMVGDDLGTLLAAARSGAGVVLAPDYCVRDDITRGRLVPVLPQWHLPVSEGKWVQAITLPLSQAPASARVLAGFAREVLAPLADDQTADFDR
jgi:DNA-binding transcriptional LysR family regulator